MNTRIVLDLSTEADYEVGQLDGPPRIFIDLKNTSVEKSFSIREIESRVLKRIRHAADGKGNYRVVLDLSNPISPTVFRLKPHNPYGNRLVIDLPNEYDMEDCSADVEPHEDVVVILDAGHGGEDPGAIGINGVFEKHVTLAITKIVQSVLNEADGFRVIMTRDADYEVSLEQRRNTALKERAHLFVSIHADSFRRTAAKGASVFVLSNGRAQTELDKWLVANENRADWIGGVAARVNSNCFEEAEEFTFLNGMSREVALESSVTIGKSVLREISTVADLHPKSLTKDKKDFRVTDAGFLVLKSVQVPSILVETGFLSNPQEAKLLSTKSHQAIIGEAIARGILSHFCDNPPWHTRLRKGEVKCSYQRTHWTYRVQSGDTLGEIALAHSVTVTAIRRVNNLNSDRIYTDQILSIPVRQPQN